MEFVKLRFVEKISGQKKIQMHVQGRENAWVQTNVNVMSHTLVTNVNLLRVGALEQMIRQCVVTTVFALQRIPANAIQDMCNHQHKRTVLYPFALVSLQIKRPFVWGEESVWLPTRAAV